MRIKRIAVSVEQTPPSYGVIGLVHMRMEVHQEGREVLQLMRVENADDMKSHFDLIMDTAVREMKHHLLKES